jgi:hypothetical protein
MTTGAGFPTDISAGCAMADEVNTSWEAEDAKRNNPRTTNGATDANFAALRIEAKR